ncbi:amidohydrolase [Cryomorpha ignava]|uniref:Omega-amidase YafV n=1 Tax=Cryomorpha ignava TaxID=101383 RepID=A0A7K3WK75_9FLAO|nr:amidohydrolase [Cryomorpha ignava]NEN22053.1 amidohydrolase [Cryomorpha ignava]
MTTELKVAVLQTEIAWENAQKNLENYDNAFSKLAMPVDIVVLPEMFNTGFTMNAVEVAEEMGGESVKWLKNKSIEIESAICASLIITEKDRFYNRFIWAENGEVLIYYDKRHLFRMAEEHHTFSPGTKRPEINFKGWRIMPRVCYDLRFPVWSRSNKFDLQIYVANWPEARVSAWDKLLRARAIENQCYVIGVNRIGSDGKGISYNGHSIVIDPKGDALTAENDESDGWITAILNLESLEDFRKKFPVFMDSDRFDLEI